MWDKTPKPIFCLAPMAGVTDSAFRFICKKCGADIVYSEMASATALFFKPQKTLELLRFSLQERPYIVQLFGKKPEHFGKATRLISQGVPLIKYGNKGLYPKNTLQPPDGIDINFGCPAKKVFGHGSGAALMRKPVLAKKIIEAVTSNTKLPVSLKIRSELKTPQGVFPLLDFLKKIDINSLGVLAIMVHGRSYSQGFKGPINYQVVQNVKKYFQGTVIANGGIENIEDAKTMLAKTGADGIGLATGTYGNPLLFNQLQNLKQTSAKNKNLWVKKNQTEIALRHAHYAYKLKGERGILELRKHFLWYFKGIPNIKKLHPKIVSISTLEDVKEVIQDVHKLSKT